MGLLTDILKEIPQAAVLKEKIADIEAKYAASDTENAILKDDLRKAKTEIANLKSQIEKFAHKDELPDIQRELLKLVASELDTDGKPADVYAARLGIIRPTVQIHLDTLCDKDYLDYFGINGSSFYSLKPKGREYLLQNNLL